MPSVSDKSKKLQILTILRIFVAVLGIFVVGLICYNSRHQMLLLVKRLPVHVFAMGLVLFILANFVLSLRWLLLLRTQNVDIKYFAIAKVHFLGLFYNNIMISSVGGDMLRVWYIAKHTHRRLEAGFSVIIDRIIGLFSLFLMAMFFYLLVPVKISEDTNAEKTESFWGKITEYQSHLIVISLILILAVIFILVFPPTRKIIGLAFKRAISHFPRIRAAVGVYWQNPVSLILCVLLTFIAQALPILGFYLMGRSMEVDAAIKFYFVFFPLSWVIGAVPISPGGAGVLEISVAGLFATLPGVGLAEGIALALCQRMTFIIGSLPGVFIHLFGAHLPSDKSEFLVDSDPKIK